MFVTIAMRTPRCPISILSAIRCGATQLCGRTGLKNATADPLYGKRRRKIID